MGLMPQNDTSKKKNDGEYNMEIFESGTMKVNDV